MVITSERAIEISVVDFGAEGVEEKSTALDIKFEYVSTQLDDANKVIASLRAECDALRAALKDANDLCRSAYAIAERNGEANWPAFRKRLGDSLERQHRVMYPVYPEQYVGAPRKEGER